MIFIISVMIRSQLGKLPLQFGDITLRLNDLWDKKKQYYVGLYISQWLIIINITFCNNIISDIKHCCKIPCVTVESFQIKKKILISVFFY